MATKYKIRKGDTLGSIAQRYGVSVGSIAKGNNISNPNRVIAGRTITIGGSSGKSSKSSKGGSGGVTKSASIKTTPTPKKQVLPKVLTIAEQKAANAKKKAEAHAKANPHEDAAWKLQDNKIKDAWSTYATQFKADGKEQARLVAENQKTINKNDTRARTSNSEDFASRGMIRSSSFGDTSKRLVETYQGQRNDVNAADTKWKADQGREHAAEKKTTAQLTADNRLNAVGRLADKKAKQALVASGGGK